MAKAMNRSLANVLFSNFGDVAAGGASKVTGSMKSVEASDAGIAMRYAASVIIVPGYGLAVAQAQQKLYELVKLLQAGGVDVKFAIHPVAGRMPGHMNVLLAEAGVPYDMIYDMADINEAFAAHRCGAGHRRQRRGQPGGAHRQILADLRHADPRRRSSARQVYVIKRGQGKGYSGVENELFYANNCAMVYGDAQAVLTQMVQAVKEVEVASLKAAA